MSIYSIYVHSAQKNRVGAFVEYRFQECLGLGQWRISDVQNTLKANSSSVIDSRWHARFAALKWHEWVLLL